MNPHKQDAATTSNLQLSASEIALRKRWLQIEQSDEAIIKDEIDLLT